MVSAGERDDARIVAREVAGPLLDGLVEVEEQIDRSFLPRAGSGRQL
jgi:hypothetical protein